MELVHRSSLRAGCVDVLYAMGQDWRPLRTELESVLSSRERERAGRFRFAEDRDRFVVQAGLVRRVLAGHTGCQPRQIEFALGPKGKPGLAFPVARPPIHFNTSRSADLIVLAVALEVEVGVDVEAVRPVLEMDGIVERHFCASEAVALAALSEAARLELFHRFWTAKEAVLKATGDGIGEFLGEVEVEKLPAGQMRLIRVPAERPAAAAWSLRSLTPAAGYVGTLAVARKPIELLAHWLRPGPRPEAGEDDRNQSHECTRLVAAAES